MSFSARITDLLEAIAGFRSANVFNPWADTDPLDRSPTAPADRRKRLLEHFRCEPAMILIGEAPGYRGCHFSGLAFTAERQLMDGVVPRVSSAMLLKKPRADRITTRPAPFAEASSTIVWRTLYELGLEAKVVMFNAFAWHPHREGQPMTNRTPTTRERMEGLGILAELVAAYPDASVLPVGRLAEDSLRYLAVPFKRSLRHPSMGGAGAFRVGLKEAVAAARVDP